MKILVADDRAEDRDLLKAILSSAEFDVTTVSNGEEALERLKAEKFDLILSDILMPEMDGYSLCIEVKKDEDLRCTPFIFTSSTYMSPSDEKFALSLGADLFLTKPLDVDGILETAKSFKENLTCGKYQPKESVGAEEFERLHLKTILKTSLQKSVELENLLREQLKIKKDLEASNEKFRLVTETIEDVFWISTYGINKMVYVSPAYDVVWQRSSQSLYKYPKSFIEAIHPDDLDGYLGVLDNYHKNGRSYECDYRIIRRDGDVRWIHERGFPVEGTSEWGQLMAGICTDVTRRRQTELEKERLRAQLDQSQKMESIGNLAGGIAHDFNNILSSILGFTELALDETEKDSDLEDNLLEVYKAGKRAKDLVHQILIFARQSGEEVKPVQVKLIVKEVLEFIRSTIPTSVEIERNLSSDSVIMGNATHIHQLLMNLCVNAAYAMEDEGGILTVTLKDVVVDKSESWGKLNLKQGNYISLIVSDTGVGITPEHISSIFEPYFTTKSPGEGTGMGLAVVSGIIENHGGMITVDSTQGKGTTFTAYFPTIRRRMIQRPAEIQELPSGTERILFVDDEVPIVKMGQRVLQSLGYRVAARTSSIEALELFRAKPDDFDLVITDMTMPNMTGDDLAVELMKIRPKIPVVICTGYSKKISDETAKEIGIKAIAHKPIVKADLAKTARKVLDEAKGLTSD